MTSRPEYPGLYRICPSFKSEMGWAERHSLCFPLLKLPNMTSHVTVSVSQFAILLTMNWSKVGRLLLEGADKAETGEEDRVVRTFLFSDSHPNQAY